MPAVASDLASLLSRVALGDRTAFARVYEATSAHLFGVAVRMLNRPGMSKHAAEDVLQEAFVNIWNNAGSYSASVAQPMTWLISIVRNKALDHLRASQRRATESLSANEDEDQDMQIVDERPDPLGLLTQASDSLRVRDCMETLDAGHRQALALAYYHGLSHSEVAAHVRAPLGTVKAWVRRGLERLKQCLGD